MRVEVLMLKLVRGRSASSSSLWTGDGGLSGTVEPSEMKERCETLFEGKRACLAWFMGEDSGRLYDFFHEACLCAATLSRRVVAAPDEANF